LSGQLEKIKQAVILAGGRGARLGEFTDDMPKPMIPVGEKPVLQHQVELLVGYGIRDIIILVNYLKESIISFFKNGINFGARISYFEEPYPLGTVGGIKEIEEQLAGDFLVFYGDVMVDMDLSRMISLHRGKNSLCTLVLHPNDHPYDSDLVEINAENRIVALHPKPHDPAMYYSNLVNAGIYILSPKILQFLEKGKKSDFGRDVFPHIYKDVPMYGYVTTEYIKDMGTPERLEKVRKDFESGTITKKSYRFKQKAIFLDRDGVLNVERSFISRPKDLKLYEYTAAAVRKINQSGYLAVVVTNQSAIARNLCTIEELKLIHKKLETELGRDRAWLDAIYYCPHHPDRGYPEENPEYKIDCTCRKPKTGMFLQASRDFHIDLEQSYMIGDSERDVQAGINAGCITVGVRTGYGVRKTTVFPDYFFRNLDEAVDFIVSRPFVQCFQEAYVHYLGRKAGKPLVILIGGNTRTGKSTLAAYLQIEFRHRKVKALIVGLDNWIIHESMRKAKMNVYDRFRLPDIEQDLGRMLAGDTIRLSGYANHPDRDTFQVEYNPNQADVLIIEGVVALSSPQVRNTAGLKIFATLPEEILFERFTEYYTWRGKTMEEIVVLFEKRKIDEYNLIEKESKFADLIINTHHT
jgi:D,D-heptose 1,7-bisphosphate phosphatase